MENWYGDNVSKKMKSLEGTFNEFANTLKELNDYIETNLNVNADSAAFGKYGTKLLNSWNQNASTFGDFHTNFNNWVQTVALISKNNADFVVDANAEYRSHAGTLDGIESARNYIASDDIAYEDLDDVTKKVLENGGIPKKETKETDEDDGILEVKESENEEALVDEETETPVDEETETPVDEETETPVDEETETPVDEETETPVDEETETPVDEETETPVDEETETPVDEETETPVDEEAPEEQDATTIVDVLNNDHIEPSKDTISYEITGNNASEIYQNAKALNQQLASEQEYLENRYTDLIVGKTALQNNVDTFPGGESNENYQKLLAEYNSNIDVVQKGIKERQQVIGKLEEATVDNAWFDDGYLKDAQDWGNNDIIAAQEGMKKLNEEAQALTSIETLANDSGGNYESLNSYQMQTIVDNSNGSYSNTMQSISNNTSAASELTLKSAYELAKNTGKLEKSSQEGVSYFSASSYFDNANYVDSETGFGFSAQSSREYNNLCMSTTTGFSSGEYDTVAQTLPDGTVKFYSIEEWEQQLQK